MLFLMFSTELFSCVEEISLDPDSVAKEFGLQDYESLKAFDGKHFLYLKESEFGYDVVVIAGRYKSDSADGRQIFVLMLQKGDRGYRLQKKFEFFANDIELIEYENSKLFVNFVLESEQWGTIESDGEEVYFKLYEDPEL